MDESVHNVPRKIGVVENNPIRLSHGDGRAPSKVSARNQIEITEFDKRVKPCEEVGLTLDHDMKGVFVRKILTQKPGNTLQYSEVDAMPC